MALKHMYFSGSDIVSFGNLYLLICFLFCSFSLIFNIGNQAVSPALDIC